MPQWNYLCPLSIGTWQKYSILQVLGYFCLNVKTLPEAINYRWHGAAASKKCSPCGREKSWLERNRIWHSEGRKAHDLHGCNNAKKSNILVYANQPNSCIHECPAPQCSWKFPPLCRFQSGWFLRFWPRDLGSNKIFFRPKDLVQNGLLAARS